MRRSLIVCLPFLVSIVAALGVASGRAVAGAPAATKTILIVRHAEADTAQPGNDPPLAADGEKRAQELARVVADAKLQAVYASPLRRSRQTAEAVVQRAGGSVTVLADVAATVAAMRAVPWGGTALVVGHSNTIPDLLGGLGATPPTGKIGFDTLWVVTLAHDGAVSVVPLHYGAP
jgi:broad specificity phosphatase PhoE